MKTLGIDVGGSGIKGALVDTDRGEMLTERRRIKTPKPAEPEGMTDIMAEIIGFFDYSGPVGIGFPATIQKGIVRTAANIDPGWIGVSVPDLIADKAGCQAVALNDADAAGTAEMEFGAGKDEEGSVMIITVGTGLGTALFTDGVLVPNLELGHIILNGMPAEHYASDAARKKEDLKWKEWAKRFNEYLERLEFLIRPDLFIIGGGASKEKKFRKYSGELTVPVKLVPARLHNHAGIIGAAVAARRRLGT
mgnify:CR=1 FL=1